MKTEKEIQKQNIEASIDFLRQEQRKESAFLSDLINSRKAGSEALEFIRSEISRYQDLMKKIMDEFQVRQTNVEARHLELDQREEKHKIKIEGMKEEEKAQLKNLGRLNQMIIQAQEEKAELDKVLAENREKIGNQEVVILDILALQNEKSGIEKERDLLRIEFSTLKENAQKELEEILKGVKELTELAERRKKEADEAEYSKKAFDDEYSLKKADLEEYLSRVREVWEQVFPGRNMPMLK